jgi:hypothetical protein
MTRSWITTTIVLVLLAINAAPAGAQSRGSAGALEIAVGGLWMNTSPLTTGDAKETMPNGQAFNLFTTSTSLTQMRAAEVQVGVHLGRHLEVFGAGSFGRRQLQISATNDVENAPAVTASERLEQYAFTGGVLWFLSQSRVAPFLSAEAGQLRELHEDKTLVESGLVYMAGGGINMAFSNGGSVGARIAGRAVLRSQQFLLNTKRIMPAVGVSLFVRF